MKRLSIAGAPAGVPPKIAQWMNDTKGRIEANASSNLNSVMRRLSGVTGDRPGLQSGMVGIMYFDTTLGKPVWVNADSSGWVDATGTPV